MKTPLWIEIAVKHQGQKQSGSVKPMDSSIIKKNEQNQPQLLLQETPSEKPNNKIVKIFDHKTTIFSITFIYKGTSYCVLQTMYYAIHGCFSYCVHVP